MADLTADLESRSGYSMRGLQGRVIEALGADIVGGRSVYWRDGPGLRRRTSCAGCLLKKQ